MTWKANAAKLLWFKDQPERNKHTVWYHHVCFRTIINRKIRFCSVYAHGDNIIKLSLIKAVIRDLCLFIVISKYNIAGYCALFFPTWDETFPTAQLVNYYYCISSQVEVAIITCLIKSYVSSFFFFFCCRRSVVITLRCCWAMMEGCSCAGQTRSTRCVPITRWVFPECPAAFSVSPASSHDAYCTQYFIKHSR